MKKHETSVQRAARLYMAGSCNGSVQTMTDHDIVACRIRAFADGAAWAKRQERRKRSRSARGS
jgi:hypothetical protein